MVIKPWGYALWENIVRVMDDMFKATGVKNAYFPLIYPFKLFWKKKPSMSKASPKSVRWSPITGWKRIPTAPLVAGRRANGTAGGSADF